MNCSKMHASKDVAFLAMGVILEFLIPSQKFVISKIRQLWPSVSRNNLFALQNTCQNRFTRRLPIHCEYWCGYCETFPS